MKKRYYTVLTSTILMFVAMIAVVGIMGSYLTSYEPPRPVVEGSHTYLDENDNPVVVKPSENKGYNFLVLGHDRMAMLTDVIMLVNYNVTEGSISILQFPRDTYVSYGVATSKINASYATFFNRARANGSKQPELDALRTLADKIETALCTKISYCAIMDLNGFRNIVDTIGGVEMDVPHRLYYNDPDQNLFIDLQPGYQTLSGAQAEGFVRFRAGYVNGDLGRQDAQKLFISAFVEKLQSSVSVSTLASLAEIVLDNLYTDITISDFVYFGTNALSIDKSKITMLSMPSNAAGNHVVMVKKMMIDIVNKHFNVYEEDITEGIFDKEKIFVNQYDQSYINGYNSDQSIHGGSEVGADDVSGVTIPYAY